MMKHLLPVALVTQLTAAVACGNAHTPANVEHQHQHELAPAVGAFHSVLAPLWHMDKGPERTAKTCAQRDTLRERAIATGDEELAEATRALVTACEEDERPHFEARFGQVHERFHAVAKKK